jgi:hypothetical protein
LNDVTQAPDGAGGKTTLPADEKNPQPGPRYGGRSTDLWPRRSFPL